MWKTQLSLQKLYRASSAWTELKHSHDNPQLYKDLIVMVVLVPTPVTIGHCSDK